MEITKHELSDIRRGYGDNPPWSRELAMVRVVMRVVGL